MLHLSLYMYKCCVSSFSFSLSSLLWLEAVYKSGRRLHPPTTMYRTDERKRHEDRKWGRTRGWGTLQERRGQGRNRSRCCIRCNEATSMHCGIFRDWNLGRALLRLRYSLFFDVFFRFLTSLSLSLSLSLCHVFFWKRLHLTYPKYVNFDIYIFSEIIILFIVKYNFILF